MIVLNLFNDPTPTGIINQRLVTHVVRLYAYTDLTEKEKKDLSEILYFVGMKLAAVWRHLNNYTTIEDRLIKEAQGSAGIEKQAIKHIRYEQDLFLELDEFLVQLKSSLDYLVKIPRAIVGRNVWSLSTLHKKGDAVINALRGSLPDKYIEKARIIDIAVQAAIAFEEARGCKVESVESDTRGFDLVSRRFRDDPSREGIETRFIEVKGRARVGEIALTANEYKAAQSLSDEYWLYVVFNCAFEPQLTAIQSPARLEWEALSKIDCYRIRAEGLLQGTS
jgi:hypothetical protein